MFSSEMYVPGGGRLSFSAKTKKEKKKGLRLWLNKTSDINILIFSLQSSEIVGQV